MEKTIRDYILEVLEYVENNGYLKDGVERVYPFISDKRDRALVHEVSYGVVRNQIFLDYVIDMHLRTGSKIEKKIRLLLRIALYQVYFLDRIPLHAIVNEAVESAKKISSKGASNLVNGLLRTVIRNKDRAFEILERDPLKKLSIEYSFPLEWVRYFDKQLNREQLIKFLSICNEPAPFVIRACGIDVLDLKKNLEEEGFETKLGSYSKQSLYIMNPQDIFFSKPYKEGYFYVQDEASQMVCSLFENKGAYRGLDICAAPGGKTFQLMERAQLGVLAADVNKRRMKVLVENKNRLKLPESPLDIAIHNASKENPNWENRFDMVIVDAPCSGLGLVRRKPEIKNRISLQDCKDLSKVQLNILENASKTLQVKGELVYSTCTVTLEENEQVLETFLQRHRNFTIKKDWQRYWPHLHGTDGFSMICLTRVK